LGGPSLQLPENYVPKQTLTVTFEEMQQIAQENEIAQQRTPSYPSSGNSTPKVNTSYTSLPSPHTQSATSTLRSDQFSPVDYSRSNTLRNDQIMYTDPQGSRSNSLRGQGQLTIDMNQLNLKEEELDEDLPTYESLSKAVGSRIQTDLEAQNSNSGPYHYS
jgi:hypothetical protein